MLFYCLFLLFTCILSINRKKEKGKTFHSPFLLSQKHMRYPMHSAKERSCDHIYMIRKTDLSFKLIQLKNQSDQEIFDHAVSGIDLSHCTCPVCKNVGLFQKMDPYERQMITVEDNERVVVPVFVPRCICEVCGHTESFLPDNLIPFSSYTLRFVITVLYEYLNRPGTVKDLCSSWQIAVSTLYVWIHLFSEHFSLWKKSPNRISRLSKDYLDQILETSPSAFYNTFGFSFMQRCGIVRYSGSVYLTRPVPGVPTG